MAPKRARTKTKAKSSAPAPSASSSYRPSSEGTVNEKEHPSETRKSKRIRGLKVSETGDLPGTKTKALKMTPGDIKSTKGLPPDDTQSPGEQSPIHVTPPKEQPTNNNESAEEQIPDDAQPPGDQPPDDITSTEEQHTNINKSAGEQIPEDPQPPEEQSADNIDSFSEQSTSNKVSAEEQRPNDVPSVAAMPPDDIESPSEPHQRPLSDEERLIATLKEKCQNMKEQHRRLKERVDSLENWTAEMQHKYNYLAADPSGWGCRAHDYYKTQFSRLYSHLRNCADNYVHEKTAVLDGLPANWKKNLVKSLDGYCAQIDLDEILGALELGDIFGTEIVTMFLVKDCFERFFLNPFWYIVPHPGEGTEYDEEVLPRATRFGTGLYELFKKVNTGGDARGLLAQSWRLWTARLCSTNGYDDQSSFPKSMIARRNLMISAMVKEVMAHELLKPLLKTPSDDEMASHFERRLTGIYQHAAELSLSLSKDDHYVVIHNLHEIGEVFDQWNPETEADISHESDSDSLHGHRIMSMTFPAVYFGGGFASPDYRELVTKANVYVEDKTTLPKTDPTEKNND
ncbi:hypothetical protein AbraIFM66951_002599 [Aspergillus brasiliensis]|uniref:Uncharacterized protein n=1 Tax=Aspergillus brasiliensis TaxID=319629 RepID=A0A9W5YZE8_9EURO|nr:hypothetical protein AbraCBS73388_002606 [Aspergillus brasiliensis]GKZ49890.1 hypothetical protein AbraIFM66951_002599 [Aspergillus brasiliensis]